MHHEDVSNGSMQEVQVRNIAFQNIMQSSCTDKYVALSFIFDVPHPIFFFRKEVPQNTK